MSDAPDRSDQVITGSARSIVEVLKETLSGNDVRRVYGDPIDKSGRTIIPIADIGSAFGFGSGSGGDAKHGQGEGGGGGGKVRSKPIGFLEISEDRVRFTPTLDTTKIATLSIVAGAFLLWMLIRKL